MTVAAAVLVALLTLGAAVSLLLRDGTLPERAVAVATTASLAALGLLAVVAGTVTGSASGLARSVLVALFFVAALGGGPVTATMLWLVDRGGDRDEPIKAAGEVLRGGAWIGLLERAGVFASLVAGWPEGLAIVLGLKGLGRYPELRNQERTGAAERFIIGTFTSVLWAAACAGVVRLLV
jgi:cytochrome bd-type quinol oxidase subunit 2